MAIERTLSIIKPDATTRNITGKVNAMIEAAGFRIVAQRRMRWTIEQAGNFYGVHKGKPFYDDLVKYMASAPVVAQVLEKDNAVLDYRTLMGATDPKKAAEGTIRHAFAFDGQEIRENTVHGSDSLDNAKMEIAQFFTEADMFV